jgi:hypothetical protein
MSSWVSLNDENGEYLFVDPFEEGGTFALGGTDEACLNVTWNYNEFYHKVIDKESGIRWLDGKKAKDTVDILWSAVNRLDENDTDDDYWKATEGNARKPLVRLLKWAKQHPEGVWRVN